MFFLRRSVNKISITEDIFSKTRYTFISIRNYDAAKKKTEDTNEYRFRVLHIHPPKKKARAVAEVKKNNPPRTKLMKTDQDWPSVWPGPRTFHPAVVPLPLRQGATKTKSQVPPGKFCNTELMKIPNFLHLTPLAIERHCNAIKKFCTKWPENLDTEEEMAKYFPVDIITSDYCHSSPTIRDPLARIVTLKVKLSTLKLDEHARDKFLRLVGPRYDPKTDVLTITTQNCPRRYQNYDYAHYLLTALYYESWKYEEWEKDRVDEDQEIYIWEKRKSKKSVEEVFKYTNTEVPDTRQFAQAVEKLMNEEESVANLEEYKEAALKLLSLPKLEGKDSLEL